MVKTGLKYAGASDTGRVRRNNEDLFHADAEKGLFLVVDGMGGQAAGEKAAEIAVERIRARMERQTGATEQRIREAIAVANNEIFEAAGSNAGWRGMACVLTMAVIENGSAVIGHVGDSRLYKIRGGSITKLTRDHSPVGEREDGGELTEAEAMRHPRRNEVFRDVGSEEHSPDDPDFIEISRVPFEPDAAFLLCSDGLSDQVDSKSIRLILERNAGNPQEAVRELIEAANRAGGKDNVTAIVVEGPRFAAAPVANPRPEPERQRVSTLSIVLAAFGIASLLLGLYVLRNRPKQPAESQGSTVLRVGADAQYPTIAAALAAARPGDTVSVAAGEYREQIILKNGVTVRSAAPLAATLRAAPMSAGPAVIGRSVSNARLSGFRILADQQAPLAVGIGLTDANAEIDEVEIAGAEIAVEIRGRANAVLRANSIRDCGAGVVVAGESQPWLSHNTFRRTKRAGVAALEGARPLLVDNVFDKSALELGADVQMDDVRARNTFVGAPLVRGGRKQ